MTEKIVLTLEDGTTIERFAREWTSEDNFFRHNVKMIVWHDTLTEIETHQFGRLMRIIRCLLPSNGLLWLKLSDTQKLPFPEDTLGAVVAGRIVKEADETFRLVEPGLQIEGVHKGGIAEKAGLETGDILLSFDGQDVSISHHPWKAFSGKQNEQIEISFERNGSVRTIQVPCNPPMTIEQRHGRIANCFGFVHLGEGRYQVLTRNHSEKPLVSILMHAYKPRWFKEALISAMNQSYQNIEILIGDDCPNNGIKDIYLKLAHNDSRVVYHKNDPPLGGWGAGNRYACFQRANGEFIKYLCDDDVLMPDCVEKLLSAILTQPTATLATSHVEAIDEQGNPKKPQTETVRRLLSSDALLDGLSATNILIGLFHNAIGTPSATLFRKSDVQRQPFYIDSFCGIESEYGLDDVNLWAALLLRGDLAYVAKPLSQFRISDEQGTLDPKLFFDGGHKWQRLLKHLHSFGFMGMTKDFVLKIRSKETAVPDTQQTQIEPKDLKNRILSMHDQNPQKAFAELRRFIAENPHWPQAPLLMFQLYPKIKKQWERLPETQMLKTYRSIVDNMATTAIKSAQPVNALFKRDKENKQLAYISTQSMPLRFRFVLEFEKGPLTLSWTVNDGEKKQVSSPQNIAVIDIESTAETPGLTIEYWATDHEKQPLKPSKCTLNRVFF